MINNFHASGFAKNSSYPVETIGDHDFRELYGSFGYEQGVYQDPNSLSYISALSEDVRLFMIDGNRYSNNNACLKLDASGSISKDSLKWLKACLEEAKTKGITPITVMHYNLLNHIDRMAKVVGEFNVAFFSGSVNRKQEELLANEGYAYREKTEGQFMKQYMDSALLKPVKDENELQITLQ